MLATILLLAAFQIQIQQPRFPNVDTLSVWAEQQQSDAQRQSAERKAIAEKKNELQRRWNEFADHANKCSQTLGSDVPDRKSCRKASKAWEKLTGFEAWPQ